MVNAPESQFRDIPHFTPSAGFGEDQLDHVPRSGKRGRSKQRKNGSTLIYSNSLGRGGEFLRSPDHGKKILKHFKRYRSLYQFTSLITVGFAKLFVCFV